MRGHAKGNATVEGNVDVIVNGARVGDVARRLWRRGR